MPVAMAPASASRQDNADSAPAAVGRLLRAADFQRVLALAPCARSSHFAAHHLAARPSLPGKPQAKLTCEPLAQVICTELSTGDAPAFPPPVDDSPVTVLSGCWLGLVVPKKHARRAVTRNLIKRQMRAVMRSGAAQLPAGLWVLRLKAPFDRTLFASPASVQLLQAARAELLLLLQRAVAPRR